MKLRHMFYYACDSIDDLSATIFDHRWCRLSQFCKLRNPVRNAVAFEKNVHTEKISRKDFEDYSRWYRWYFVRLSKNDMPKEVALRIANSWLKSQWRKIDEAGAEKM